MNGLLYAPAVLSPEQNPRTHWIGGYVQLRASADISEKRNVFKQAVWFRRLPCSVIRGRLISQINARLHDVTSLNWVTSTVKTLCGSNVDIFAQVNAFRFWRAWMSSGPSDLLIDNLRDFSGFSYVNSGLVPSNCARSLPSEFLFRHSYSWEWYSCYIRHCTACASVSSVVRPFSGANSTI
jgi:hypothetical protein